MNKTDLLDRCARDGEERLILARVLDKLDFAQTRNAPAHTQFLSPSQQQAVTLLLHRAGHPRHLFFGGYEGAERRICYFPPEWQEGEEPPPGEESPLAALEALLPPDATVNHRDILGALMGLGLTREKVGDILVEEGRCQVIFLGEVLPILLSQWDSAGRYRLKPRQLPLEQLHVTSPQVRVIRDTVATLRLDAVVASAFSLSRSKAAELVSAGRVSLNHRECAKNDRPVAEGDTLSCRGFGKCVLRQVAGQSRKGRIMVVLERYE